MVIIAPNTSKNISPTAIPAAMEADDEFSASEISILLQFESLLSFTVNGMEIPFSFLVCSKVYKRSSEKKIIFLVGKIKI